MYIREIHIENIRCFGEAEQGVHLDLTRPDGSLAGWTVIAGRNGTGKSTLLKAIALAVAGPAFGQAIQMQEGLADWIRSGVDEGAVRVTLERSPKDKYLQKSRGKRRISTGIRLKKEAGGAEPRMSPEGDDSADRRGPWAVNPRGWMIAGYGPFRRIGRRDERPEPGPVMMSALRSLFDAETVLHEPLDWLKTVYMKWLGMREKVQDAKERGDDVAVSQLEERAAEYDQLKSRVLTLLNNDLLPEGSKIADFDMDGLWVEREGVVLPLHRLSDGYRTAIALVFDLIYRICRCYSEFEIEEHLSEDGKQSVTVPYEGVALIDEVDTHLHVSWQKYIGFWLKRHFPNIQFIVTTHSPFVCQAADPNGLIRLAAPGEPRPVGHVSEDVYNIVVNGSADAAVMTELFGEESPRSDAAEELRDEVSELESRVIQGKATKVERARLKDLSARLPSTPSADVERALLRLSAKVDARLRSKR